MKFKVFALITAVLLLLGLGQTAQAQLTAVGPVNPATEFPTFFTDAAPNLISLGPCDVITNPVGGVNGPPCGALALTNFASGFVTDNIEEVTYYRAESVVPPGSRIRIEVQGGCGNLPPFGPLNPCEEVVINGATFRLNPAHLTAAPAGIGNYRLITPVGEFTIAVADPAVVQNGTFGPTGTGVAPTFVAAENGVVSQFVPNGTGPLGFLGDSLTPAALTAGSGWPTQVLSAVGPGALLFQLIDPVGATKINEPTFTVEGKVAAFPLSVTLAGNGTGTVAGAPPGLDATINCPGICTASFAPATVVTLTATATVGHFFTSWTGCTPGALPNVCTVTMNLAANVTATFSAASISVAPPTGAFGNVNVSSVKNMTFTVTNSGVVNVLMGTATVANVIPTDLHFTKAADTCSGQTLLPGGSCIIQVRFLPTLAAVMGGSLTIPSNDPDPAPVIPLNGTGSNGQAFGDVLATSFAENHINSLFNNGITTGCVANPPQFCPSQLVTREQMAGFIIRADEGEPAATIITVPMSPAQEVPPVTSAATGNASLIVNLVTGALSGTINFSGLAAGGISLAHIHQGAFGANGPPIVTFTGFTAGQTTGTVTISGVLTPAQINSLIAGNLYFNIHSVTFVDGEIRGQILPRFTDVPFNNFFFRHIERMAILGITQGIGGGLYGPIQNVTREQMAAFIIRAVFPGNPPGVCAAPPFPDVPVTNEFCRHIEELKARNITLGFPDGTYQPLGNVTREQMAAFIARAFLGIP